MMMTKQVKTIWFILIATALIRLITLALYPLMDTTEARYGEMARIMVETGNWLTPQFDYGVPFWGKPPLFTWMSSLGIEVFGLNEFAVRFPHWLAGVAVILVVAHFANKHNVNALIASLVIATSAVFSISAGAVMTDMALTLSMAIAMIGFYQCWHGSTKAGLLGFFGIALGLLAKGPLIIVLIGLSLVPWIILNYGVKNGIALFIKRVPIIKGIVIISVIALPWYLMAENATPGFLNYFIVGEHFQRFMVSGWEGDLYGKAHNEVKGMIWLFWIYAAAPWSIILPILAWRSQKEKQDTIKRNSDLKSYLFFWMISPMILFTLSGNILPAYVLPGIPALGLLVSLLTFKKSIKWVSISASLIPILLIAALIFIQFGKTEQKSDKYMMKHVNLNNPIYYLNKKSFSGQFYSQGKAKVFNKINEEVLKEMPIQLIATDKEIAQFKENNNIGCNLVFSSKNKRSLYHCRTAR